MELVDHLAAAAEHLHAARTLEPHDIAATMAQVQDISRLAQAISLELAAAAHAADTARSQGSASTQSWLAHTSGVSHREAAKELKLATELQSVAPRTREAMSLPGMSTEKARVITRAMSSLPAQLDTDERSTVEADLVERAQRHSVDDLRRAAKRAVEVLDAAGPIVSRPRRSTAKNGARTAAASSGCGRPMTTAWSRADSSSPSSRRTS